MKFLKVFLSESLKNISKESFDEFQKKAFQIIGEISKRVPRRVSEIILERIPVGIGGVVT